MSDGMDCICSAYGPSECGCGADWTPQIVYDLRDENKRLRIALMKIANGKYGGRYYESYDSLKGVAEDALKSTKG